MTKGTLIFRIIISVLLAFTMLFTAFFVVVFAAFVNKDVKSTESYLNVAGVNVTWKNREDILGDGTVSFDPERNVLTFNNAEIEYDYAVIYSKIDIMVELIGENKFVLSGDVVPAIHVSDFSLSKDILIFGEVSIGKLRPFLLVLGGSLCITVAGHINKKELFVNVIEIDCDGLSGCRADSR